MNGIADFQNIKTNGNKCCYCKNTVTKNDGFTGVISYHDKCIKNVFILKPKVYNPESVKYYEGWKFVEQTF